jgi:hypothetical protein
MKVRAQVPVSKPVWQSFSVRQPNANRSRPEFQARFDVTRFQQGYFLSYQFQFVAKIN